ncbi:hypothetical protein LSH36_132g01073 [Paralvinella palmiformis]|uniref:DUF7802 domain-containing protein n=1 Tax=Paralvinella palmiformis TaxID=53620 RepID=A0AAD9JXU9_9ANNE|nr:hypothetical protein LSH36_132g01073 [Paralvinella palmiformis]
MYLFFKDLEWWVSIRHPKEIWENHPSYLVGEVTFYIFGLLTLKHALRLRGRFPYLWLASVLHGLTVESISYFLPDIDNFWHAQSMVMLLGRRLPLHIIIVYPVFIYTASVAVARLRLSRWAEPFAVGLAVVLIDIPFDIMGIKLLWWTWHDTDPNLFDRMYWVPWNSYYFHATFFKEIICCLLTGMFSFPLGTLQFIPIYHTLHDKYHIHTEVCVFLLIGVYMLMWWTGDRHPEHDARTLPNKGWFDELALVIYLHYFLYMLLVFIDEPQNIKSIGVHEMIGECNATTSMVTALGQTVSKRKYLCLNDYDEGYYDFHCADPPQHGTEWYTICGNGYTNHMEYEVIITGLSLFGLYVYTQMMKYSGRQARTGLPRAVMHKMKRH